MEDIPPPQVWYCTIAAGPKAARAMVEEYDGVTLYPFLTPEAVAGAVKRIRDECERIGRDPATFRIAHCITTAPELDDFETRVLCHARLVTYLQGFGFGESLAAANGWGEDLLHKVRNHEQLQSLQKDGLTADEVFHRAELLEPAKVIPDSLIEEVCAIGSVDRCVETIRGFRDAGADETVIYGPRPSVNAKLLDAWRNSRARVA